jgi:hypothetical protein
MKDAQELSRSPLMYTAVAGVVILILYLLVSFDQAWRPGRHIIISVEQQQELAANFAGDWQREPSESEMIEMLDDLARREIAWREATRLALGQDDAVIRRRLQHHLELIATGEATRVPPTREELQIFLGDHADDFRVDPVLTFRQIYFDNNGNVIGADATARFMLGKLRNQKMPDDLSELGDPSSLPVYIDEVQVSDLIPVFGREFTGSLFAAPVGEWIGPFPSALGLHIVYIDSRSAGRLPDLDEIADAVEEAWRSAKRSAAIEDFYVTLTEKYKVTIQQQNTGE